MSQQHNTQPDIKYQLLVSLLGLLLIVLLTVFPPTITTDFPWRKPVIGSIFSIFCLLGILAVFSSKQCFRLFNFRKKSETAGSDSTKFSSNDPSNVLQGHHPTCGKFTAHIFRIRNRTFCAACIGLLLGGLIGLAGASTYFFGNWQVTEHITLIVLLGSLGVSLGLFQFKFRSFVRLFMNTLFVLGSLLVLIGIDALVQSLFFDLFVVCLIVFWLFNRISLSQWDHEIICSGCETENCMSRK